MARRYTMRPFLDLPFVTRSDGRRMGNARLFKKHRSVFEEHNIG